MEEHKTYIHELYIEVLICNKNKRNFVSNCKKHDKNSWDVHNLLDLGNAYSCILCPIWSFILMDNCNKLCNDM